MSSPLPGYIKTGFLRLGLLLFAVGLLYSSALLSISVLIIALQVFLFESPKAVFKAYFKSRIAMLFLAFFLFHVLQGFYTSDPTAYMNDLIIKLPCIFIPLGMQNKEFYTIRNFRFLSLSLIVVVFLTGLGTFINYLVFKDFIDLMILQSKAIPIISGMNHIYFSFILAFTTLLGIIYFLRYSSLNWLKIGIGLLSIFNLLFLHVISARTGLAAFYVCVFALLIYHGIVNRRWVLMFSLLIVFTGLLLGSVRYIPSLHNRFINTMQDIEAFRKGRDINHRSISMRLAAWEKSIEIFEDNPLWGVANADVHDEIKRRYEISNKYDLSIENQKGPHNQFFYILAASGIFGFILFVLLMIHPVLVFFRRRDYLIFAIFIVMLVSFLVESVLERQVGVSFFCFFWTYFSKPREFRNQN